VPGVYPGKLEITGGAQGKNGELRQRVRRELIEQFRPLLAKQQHADGMEREIGNLRRALLAL
jgi:selenophosphate synthase